MTTGSCFPVNGKIETESMSVVLAQMCGVAAAGSPEEVDKNIDKVFEYMDRAAVGLAGYDIFVTPEIVLNGFGPYFVNSAITKDGPQMKRLQAKCKELSTWGVFGCIMDFQDGHFVRNCAVTINDKGEIVNIYTKTNPWIPVEPTYPGEEIQVFDGPKGSKIATLICADGDYQETWKEAAFKGANVIIRISDYMTPYQQQYEITNRAGAYFNRCYVLATNTSEMDEAFCLFGHSMAVGPDGNIIDEAPLFSPYLLKVDVYPQLCEHMQKQSFMGNLLWQGNHRGASCPECAGVGKSAESLYTYFKAKY